MINKDMTVGEVLRSCSDAAMDAVVKIFTDMEINNEMLEDNQNKKIKGFERRRRDSNPRTGMNR